MSHWMDNCKEPDEEVRKLTAQEWEEFRQLKKDVALLKQEAEAMQRTKKLLRKQVRILAVMAWKRRQGKWMAVRSK